MKKDMKAIRWIGSLIILLFQVAMLRAQTIN
jgi:hypothetical protein